jgi:NAD+ kinase
VPWSLPALVVARDRGSKLFALNDLTIVRDGAGQVRVSVEVDGNLFARIAGDGCVVSTPIGSSAYALAAGGPLLAPDMDAFVVTPLPTHGGSCPPFVVGGRSVVRLDPIAGPIGARLELDGQVADRSAEPLSINFASDVATVVTFPDQVSFVALLRERQIITDSPRILAEDARL